MSANPRFSDRDYARRCAMCGWVDEPPPAWEEGLRRPSYCPDCGVPLEVLSCAHCGAPVFTDTVPTIAGYRTVFGRHCPECGESVTRHEPRMVKRKRRAPKKKIAKLGPDGRPAVEGLMPDAWVQNDDSEEDK